MIDFTDISYLKSGTLIQQQAYEVLIKYAVLNILEAFGPVLAGTIPININTEGSDLDILCCWQQKEEFSEKIIEHFSENRAFVIREIAIHSHPAVIANFFLDDFEIEIFGQNIPVQQQHGYRHLLIEHILLLLYGEEFRKKIIELKRQGYKTEPAFAMLLGLSGDPYQSLLDYGKRLAIH
jgi:hypothetical protein